MKKLKLLWYTLTIIPIILLVLGYVYPSAFFSSQDQIKDFIEPYGIFAPIMFVVGGFQFMAAAGDPQKLTKAKNIMIYTAIGLAVVLAAKALVSLLKDLLGVEEPAVYFKNIWFFGIIGLDSIKSLLPKGTVRIKQLLKGRIVF